MFFPLNAHDAVCFARVVHVAEFFPLKNHKFAFTMNVVNRPAPFMMLSEIARTIVTVLATVALRDAAFIIESEAVRML